MVPQLSSKKTTGYSFGLSVERVLKTGPNEEAPIKPIDESKKEPQKLALDGEMTLA
jgi:hypothetical protein